MGKDPIFERLYEELKYKNFDELERYRKRAIVEVKHEKRRFLILMLVPLGAFSLFLLPIVIKVALVDETSLEIFMKIYAFFVAVAVIGGIFGLIGYLKMIFDVGGKNGKSHREYNDEFKKRAWRSKYSKEDADAGEKYKNAYEERILTPIIKSFDDSFSYNHDEKLDSRIYSEAGFNDYNAFRSEDLIQGTYKNKYDMKIAEVQTLLELESTDSGRENYTHKKEFFQGLFAVVDIPTKSFTDSIFIRKNEIKVVKPELKVELDSSVFEKYFDVYSTNKIFTYQIITSDVIQFLMNFQNEMQCDFDLNIKNGKLYIRFKCGSILVPPGPMEYPLDKGRIYTYYSLLKFTFILIDKLAETIEGTEV